MKVAAGFLYVLAQVIYLMPWVPGNRYTYAFNIITHVAMATHMFYLAEKNKSYKRIERLLYEYLKIVGIGNCIYIAVCAIKDKPFNIYHTPLFAYILGIGFAVFLIHCAYRKL